MPEWQQDADWGIGVPLASEPWKEPFQTKDLYEPDILIYPRRTSPLKVSASAKHGFQHVN
jgi:hypothetical protein